VREQPTIDLEPPYNPAKAQATLDHFEATNPAFKKFLDEL